MDFQPKTGAGQPGVDFFVSLSPGRLEVRLKRGALMQAQAVNPQTAAHFIAAWPEGDEQPALVALFAPIPSVEGLFAISEPGPLPAILQEQSQRPSAAEWVKGSPVNTASKTDWAPGCEMRILREWLRVQCGWVNGSSRWLEPAQGFGKLGEDYFSSNGSQLAELTVRLRPGVNGSAKFRSNGPGATLDIAWPEGASSPSTVALRR